MDVGLCPGNYHDYSDDEIAIQREFEIGDILEGSYRDEEFPPNARSLYFDPQYPPKGSIPNESVKWFSICSGDLVDCDDPVYCNGDIDSCLIEQGALGDGYFINAIRLLSCQPHFINRLLVSEKFASVGLYTFKFYKAGKWRYVHIDDRIPCRQSGRVNFAHNRNPNELFAMLLEKAYAKLHGCYEAVPYGLVEKVLHELTPSAGVRCLRLERHRVDAVCDEVWDVLEKAVEHGALIGCGRFLENPYATNPAKAKGITSGWMYQVVDVCITSAEPTADLDAITLGMVCIRNLQRNSGRFTGRWSYSHKLWAQYKEIAFDLRHRTREIQFKRGLRKNPNEEMEEEADEADMRRSTRKNYPIDTMDKDDERDELDMSIIEEEQQTVKLVQPHAEDLYWIQIEDFVEIFNRVYVVNDVSLQKAGVTKRYVSRWIPGDYIGGSGGPPIVIQSHLRDEDGSIQEETDDQDAKEHAQLVATAESKDGIVQSNAVTAKGGEDDGPAVAIAVTTAAADGKQVQIKDADDMTAVTDPNSQEDKERQRLRRGSKNTDSDKDDPKPKGILERYAAINDTFTDNPMYPFTVTEASNVAITLYQKDKRWNIGRLGENAKEVAVNEFSSRGFRLQACMRYLVGIGFLVVRLSGLKHRLTEFKLKKIIAGSEGLVFSNVASNTLFLTPGRYAIIPYTHCILDRAMDYALHIQFLSSHVEFEVENVLEQRLIDEEPSEVDENEDLEPDDNDLLKLHEDTDDISVMSFERVNLLDIAEDNAVGADDGKPYRILTAEDDEAAELAMLQPGDFTKAVAPPRPLIYKSWEYAEDSEELGVQHVFGEVGDVMKYVKMLRGEVRKLNATIRMLSATGGQAMTGEVTAEQQFAADLPDFMHDMDEEQRSEGSGSSRGSGGRQVQVLSPVKRY